MTNDPKANAATPSRAIDHARLIAICRRLLDWARNTGGWEAPVWTELRDALEGRTPDDRTVEGVLALVDAAALVVGSARWERDSTDEPDRAAVRKHDLVLLEAAVNTVTGRRSPSPDGYPHAGSEISARGFCEVGFCPCQDRPRDPQPAPLQDAA